MAFYNILELFGPELKKAEQQAQSQDEMVYEAFQRLNMPLGPSMVHKYLINSGKITQKTPITSLRRSITNLAKDGKLQKTEKKVMGNWGQKEHQWTLKQNQ